MDYAEQHNQIDRDLTRQEANREMALTKPSAPIKRADKIRLIALMEEHMRDDNAADEDLF